MNMLSNVQMKSDKVAAMKLLHLLIIYSLFINVQLTELNNEQSKACKWVYRCCDIIGEVCQQMCEPEIICETDQHDLNSETTDKYQLIKSQACIKGYRYQNKKCRRVLK